METGLTTLAVLVTSQIVIAGLVVWSHFMLRRFLQIEFRRDTDRKDRRAARSQSVSEVPELSLDLLKTMSPGGVTDGSI